MNYRVVIQPPALENIEYAYLRAARHAPDTALRWMEGFHKALQTLSENPLRCSVAPESDAVELEIRQLFYRTKSRRSYRALFTIQGDEVRILHVRSPGQRLMRSGEIESSS